MALFRIPIPNSPFKKYAVTGATAKPTTASEIALGLPAIPPGSECWDSAANILYKTLDGTNWVLFVTLA